MNCEDGSMNFQQVLEAFESDFHTVTPQKKQHLRSNHASLHTSRGRNNHAHKLTNNNIFQTTQRRRLSNEEDDHPRTAASWNANISIGDEEEEGDAAQLKQSPYDVRFDVLGNTLYETIHDCFSRTDAATTTTTSHHSFMNRHRLAQASSTCGKYRFEASLDNIYITEDQLFGEDTHMPSEKEEEEEEAGHVQAFQSNEGHHLNQDRQTTAAASNLVDNDEEDEDFDEEEEVSSNESFDEDKENKDPLIPSTTMWEGEATMQQSMNMRSPSHRSGSINGSAQSTSTVRFREEAHTQHIEAWYASSNSNRIEEEEVATASLQPLDSHIVNSQFVWATTTAVTSSSNSEQMMINYQNHLLQQQQQQVLSSRVPINNVRGTTSVTATSNSFHRTPLRDITSSTITSSSSKKSSYKGVKKTLQFNSPAINAWTSSTATADSSQKQRTRVQSSQNSSASAKYSPLPAMLYR